MRLATVRTAAGTRAARVDDQSAVLLGAVSVDDLLARPDWRAGAATAVGDELPVDGLDYAPLVLHPEKIICVGLNYRSHILEMGRDLPTYPTLFAKFARTLVGAYDDICLPAESTAMDWEAELGVVVGTALRRATPDEAADAIGGFCVVNDVTARDYQYRTTEWLQGKVWEATTPVGPWLVTPDDPAVHSIAPAKSITCAIGDRLVQDSDTGDLVFSPAELLAYLSTLITLMPGDLIATGTPGGVGHARTPPEYLHDGMTVTTTIAGIGACHNLCRTAS